MDFDRDKFKKLVHYICEQAGGLDFGSTKLNKCLWFSDTIAYLKLGRPITGERYVARQFGPVPFDILPVQRELVREGKIAVGEPSAEFDNREFMSQKKADASEFTQDEIGIVQQVIHFVCCEHTARSISNLTHDRLWKLAAIGEDIPYEAMFIARPGEIDEHDVSWANRELAGG